MNYPISIPKPDRLATKQVLTELSLEGLLDTTRNDVPHGLQQFLNLTVAVGDELDDEPPIDLCQKAGESGEWQIIGDGEMMEHGESQQNIRGIAFNYRQPLFVFPVDTGTKADQMEQQQKREKRARSGSHVPWLDMHRCSLGHPPSQQAVQWIRYLLGGFALGSLVPWLAILLQIRPFRKSESESWLDRVRFNFLGKPHGWRKPAPRRGLEPRNVKHTRAVGCGSTFWVCHMGGENRPRDGALSPEM